ncbi:serine hydrolase FSH [Aspergillus terricola var. indicus]
MRFLCLHGAGTSGAIFRAQTDAYSLAAFREKLDPSRHSFEFVDAPHPSPAGPGVFPFFPPPYFSFWRSTDPKEVAQTHQWLLSYLHGQPQPYDALLCFSQGCSVAASLILEHQNEQPQVPLPFRAVVFICGGLPLPILANWGLPISAAAWEVHERTASELWEQAGAVESILTARQAKLDASQARPAANSLLADPESENLYAPPAIDPHNVFGLDLTRFPESCRLNLPTLHIIGSQDPRCPSAIQLALLSAAGQRLVYDHGGGHEVPRTTRVSEAIAAAVGWLEACLDACLDDCKG